MCSAVVALVVQAGLLLRVPELGLRLGRIAYPAPSGQGADGFDRQGNVGEVEACQNIAGDRRVVDQLAGVGAHHGQLEEPVVGAVGIGVVNDRNGIAVVEVDLAEEESVVSPHVGDALFGEAVRLGGVCSHRKSVAGEQGIMYR